MIDNLEKKQPEVSLTLGGELKTGWDSTERLLERTESFSILKHRTMDFYDWGMDGGIPQFDKSTTKTFRLLKDCGQYLIFRNYLKSKRSRLIGACSCKMHLLCAFCASRRGVKNAMAYKEKVDFLMASNPDQDLMFLTFTVKNQEDLMTVFSHIRNSMQRLLKNRNEQARVNRRGTLETEMAKLSGGVFAYEFKRGSGQNLWHPHIHMLALKPKNAFIDIQALKDEWLAITEDSTNINIGYCTSEGEPFLEVFAYALKFSEMSHPDRWFAAQLLRRERLISSFGDLRGIDIGDDVTDDILVSDEPYVDVLFKWFIHRGYEPMKVLMDSLEPLKHP